MGFLSSTVSEIYKERWQSLNENLQSVMHLRWTHYYYVFITMSLLKIIGGSSEISSNSPWADTLFWLHLGIKTWYGFLETSGRLLSRKVRWVVRIGSFYPKLSYFTDQNGPKGGAHENEFWLFSNTKINVTNSYSGKSRWKKMASFV